MNFSAEALAHWTADVFERLQIGIPVGAGLLAELKATGERVGCPFDRAVSAGAKSLRTAG